MFTDRLGVNGALELSAPLNMASYGGKHAYLASQSRK